MAEYIEKQEALDGMRQLPHEYKTKEQRARTGGIAACQMVVKNIEPADVRPVVRGQWIMRGGKFHCSKCDAKALWRREDGTNGFSHEYTQKKSDFCPNCGADLRGGDYK